MTTAMTTAVRSGAARTATQDKVPAFPSAGVNLVTALTAGQIESFSKRRQVCGFFSRVCVCV